MIKAGNPSEDQVKSVKRIMEAMKTANSEPSESCTSAEHKFKFVMHGDGAKSYFNLFECEHCGEFVKQGHQRTGEDAEWWSDHES